MSFEINYFKILIATKAEADHILYSIHVKNINVYSLCVKYAIPLKL